MYFAASFKNLSTGKIDISANGVQLSIVDNSNYRSYTGNAIVGGAATITFPSDASPYTGFYVGMEIEILAGTSIGDHRYITAYDGVTKIATVGVAWTSSVDATSIFEVGEPGHLKSYFTSYRKVSISCPGSVDYLFSSIGDGDATTLPGATAFLPITDTHSYTTGDGLYTITLYTLPTWGALVPYLSIRNVYVYYSGVIYHLLTDDTGTTPGTDATVWEVITDIDALPARYRQSVRYAVLCDITACYRNFVLLADQRNKCTVCNNEIWMRNADVQKAFKLKMVIDAVPMLMYQELYDDVTNTVNLGKQLCCCG